MWTEGHRGPSVHGKRAVTLLSKDGRNQFLATQMLPKHTGCFCLIGVCVGLAKKSLSVQGSGFFFSHHTHTTP